MRDVVRSKDDQLSPVVSRTLKLVVVIAVAESASQLQAIRG